MLVSRAASTFSSSSSKKDVTKGWYGNSGYTSKSTLSHLSKANFLCCTKSDLGSLSVPFHQFWCKLFLSGNGGTLEGSTILLSINAELSSDNSENRFPHILILSADIEHLIKYSTYGISTPSQSFSVLASASIIFTTIFGAAVSCSSCIG